MMCSLQRGSQKFVILPMWSSDMSDLPVVLLIIPEPLIDCNGAESPNLGRIDSDSASQPFKRMGMDDLGNIR